jgi:uncharacterized membrane protein YgdD (TMEM256/DUF423 family)
MTPGPTAPSATQAKPAPWDRYWVIGIAGVVVVPFILVVAFNSWTAPDDADYIRMAFAQVAGQTIAITTMVGLIIASRFRRRTGAATGWLLVLAALVISGSLSAMSRSAEHLLQMIGG